MSDQMTIVRDKDHGIFVMNFGIVSRLTDCCEANATFVDDGKGGDYLACKACYQKVDDVYARAAQVGANFYWDQMKAMLKPCKASDQDECAHYVTWTLTRD